MIAAALALTSIAVAVPGAGASASVPTSTTAAACSATSSEPLLRMGGVWRIKVRNGPRVAKYKARELEEALDVVEREGRVLSAGPGRPAVELRIRTFTPQQQVAGRVELAGPGVRAGIDVRGDGASEAWTGRVRRSVIEQQDGETPYDALRRVVGQSTSVEP
jgi:hypothetical protein